jgi:hypothetical protein
MSEDEWDADIAEAVQVVIQALERQRELSKQMEKAAREEFGDEIVDVDLMISKSIYNADAQSLD